MTGRDIILFGLVLAVWFVASRYLLPKLGVAT